MTDEELEKALIELNESLSKLSDDSKLTSAERGRRYQLLLEKNALEKIKRAREKGNVSQEMRGSVDYAVLKSSQKSHPILAYLMRLKLRSTLWW